jgi:hypothetical protein
VGDQYRRSGLSSIDFYLQYQFVRVLGVEHK